MKALGSPESLSPMEILIRRDYLGKPHLELSGDAKKLADTIGVSRLHLSMTHSEEYAAAVVVLETD
jgi:holo-[acyl-carrier-protein] synthase